MVRPVDALSRIVWPLLLLFAALLWLLYTVGALSPVMIDLIERGWPVVLVVLALIMLFGRRVRFGNALAIGASAALVAGLMAVAYGRESDTVRTDYTEPINVAVDLGVTSLRATIDMGTTAVEIRPAPDRSFGGQFVGSAESLVTVDYRIEGSVGIFAVRETARNAVPRLERVGRGTLTLLIPADVPFEALTVTSRRGDLTLDLGAASVRQLTATLSGGSISAVFRNEAGLIGDLRAANDVTVTIPGGLVAEIALRGNGANNPRFSDALYTLSATKELVPRAAAAPQMQLVIEAGGTITVN